MTVLDCFQVKRVASCSAGEAASVLGNMSGQQEAEFLCLSGETLKPRCALQWHTDTCRPFCRKAQLCKCTQALTHTLYMASFSHTHIKTS